MKNVYIKQRVPEQEQNHLQFDSEKQYVNCVALCVGEFINVNPKGLFVLKIQNAEIFHVFIML